MQKGFLIEFSVDVATDGNDAQMERFRVLVKDDRAAAYEAFAGAFGETLWVEATEGSGNKAVEDRLRIIAWAFQGYITADPRVFSETPNGLTLIDIGIISKREDHDAVPPPPADPPDLLTRFRVAQDRIAELEGELRVRNDELDAARARIEAYDQQFLAYGRSVGVLDEIHGELVKAIRSEMAGLGIPGTSVEIEGVVPAVKALADHVRRRGSADHQGALVRVASGIGVMDLAAEPEKMADACLKIISHERELHRAVCGDLKGCSDALRGIMGELGVTVPRPSSVDEWPKNVRVTIIEAIDRIKEKRQRAPLDAIKEAEEFVRVRLAKIVGDKDASLDRCAWIFERVAQELRNEASSWPNRFGVNAPLDGIAQNFISDYRVMTTRHDFLERSNTEIRKLVGADSDPMTDTVAAVRDALKQGRDAAGVTAAIVRLAEAQERGLAYLQETTEIFKRVHGED